MPRALPKPYAELERGRTRLRFFHGDAIEILNTLGAGSVDAVVTSPPYNLGIRYRSYDDGRPRAEYLGWTGDWVAAARRALADRGSLFLNVGAKPKDPWTALDVAQAVRPAPRAPEHHSLGQVDRDREGAGRARGPGSTDDLAVGHYKPINSKRFLNDCHEFVFHFSRTGETPLDRRAVGVKYQDKSNVTRWQRRRLGAALPRQHLVPPLRHHPKPRQGAAAPGHVPVAAAGVLPAAARPARAFGVAVDPFLGLGSSAVACATLGVSFVGIEMDEHYLREAIARATQGARSPSKPYRPI